MTALMEKLGATDKANGIAAATHCKAQVDRAALAAKLTELRVVANDKNRCALGSSSYRAAIQNVAAFKAYSPLTLVDELKAIISAMRDDCTEDMLKSKKAILQARVVECLPTAGETCSGFTIAAGESTRCMLIPTCAIHPSVFSHRASVVV